MIERIERITPVQGANQVEQVQPVHRREAGGQLASSVERASAKGATNILAFDATRAFIINVPHGRVITTMSQEEMAENIFTNIDGAVLLK